MPISVAYFSAVVGREQREPSLKIFVFTSHGHICRSHDPSANGALPGDRNGMKIGKMLIK